MAKTPDAPRPILFSWSSGKDSAFALTAMLGDPSVEVCGLVTSVNGVHDRVAMHAVRRRLLRAQAASLGLPLHEVELPFPCSNEAYERAMETALRPHVEAGIEGMAFGDLFLEDVRRYREDQCAAVGMDSLFPLWGRETMALASEMIGSGQRAVLTCVDPEQVDPSFAGRAFDEALLADLPEGADPCGEKGEFHTFVWDGPSFSEPIGVEVSEVVERGGFHYADLLPRDV